MARNETAPAVDTDVVKKERKKPVRKPVELAVVATVKDSDGNPITDANIEILIATKDISGAFKLHKQSPGSDMITYTLNPGSNQATAEKAA